MIADMDSIASVNEWVTFYDAHRYGNHDYAENEFFDHLHLCVNGAEKLSARLDSIFTVILEN